MRSTVVTAQRQWPRQLWGIGERAPSTSNNLQRRSSDEKAVRKVFRIGTVSYNWPMSAHALQAFSIAHCTDSEDLPAVRLRLSVRHVKRVICDKTEERSVQIFDWYRPR